MNLFRSELSRLTSRRIARFLPLGVVALMFAGMTIAFFATSNSDFVDGSTPWSAVDQLTSDSGDDGLLPTIGGLLGLIAFVIGASYVGADVKTGVIEQLLTWETRRVRLFVSRLVAAFVVTFVAVVLMLIAFTLLFTGLILLRGGEVGSIDGDFLGPWISVVARSGLAGALLGMLGVAVAFMTNSSVGAIVGWFIYAFIIEGLIAAFWRSAAVYTPLANSSGYLSGDGVYSSGAEAFSIGEIHHGPGWALLILIGYVAAASVAAALMFQRRDIS